MNDKQNTQLWDEICKDHVKYCTCSCNIPTEAHCNKCDAEMEALYKRIIERKYYNGIYGHSYYFNQDKILCAVITNRDGTPDWNSYGFDVEFPVSDFNEPLTEKELAHIESKLNKL